MVKTLPLSEALRRVNLPDMDRNLFSSAGWLGVIQQTYATRFFVKYIERNGRVDSYIIYAVVCNALERKICMCSYCDYCDGVVNDARDWAILFESLRKDFPRYRIAIRNLRDTHARQSGLFHVMSQEYFHLLDIRPSLEEIWKRTHDSYRAAVTQAKRKGVVVRTCVRAELKNFYASHLAVRKNKYRLFPQPYAFFENIWDAYMETGQGFMLGAYSPHGEFLGANIFLVCGDTLYYKFNTSRHDALSWRPNNILLWEGIRLAKEKGLSYVDLGSSGHDQEGLVRFKDHVGAQMFDIIHLGYHPQGYRFSQKRLLRFATSFFTQAWMPDVFLRWGSRIIYHYLA